MPKINKVFEMVITPEQFLTSCSPDELKEIDLLIQSPRFAERMKADTCRICGCTDYDCRKCVEIAGKPCYWFEKGLCSRCAGETTKVITAENE